MRIILDTKLKLIKKVVNTENILDRTGNISEVQKYYRLNKLAYSIFHSNSGFVHVGISSSEKLFKKDFLVQPKLIGKYIENLSASNVLELAVGKGANITYLAKQYPNTNFSGLDLPQGQLNINDSRLRAIKNLTLSYGDYHKLDKYPNDSQDIIFVIEALCHSSKKKMVASEVYRVLKKNGVFIVIDGFINRRLIEISENEKLAVNLTAKGMMVTNFEEIENVINKICSAGFKLELDKNYSENILPNLNKLENLAYRSIFKHSFIGRTIAKIVPNEIINNAVSGFLMPSLVESGVATYNLLVFKKI